MAKSKTYEMLLKIAGKTDSSLKTACSEASKNLDTLGEAAHKAGQVAATALAGIATAAAGVAISAVNAGKEYQAQLANISTLLTGTEGEVAARTAEIGDQILEVSNKTGVATENLTDGMYQVISAFGDSADAASILETAAKSAAAGNATTADSINLLSAVTKGYGDTSAAAVQKAADLSFATVRLGQTSFPELAASMGKVIPLAGTLGLEQEQLFGAMATLTGVTGSTAEVVTQLKATMQGFLSPSKNMQEALSSMGYESGQALLESEGLQGALDALKDSVNGDELAFAGLFSSVEAQTAVLAMAGTQSENLAMKTAEMYEATGAADTAFRRQTKNLKYTIQTVKNLGQNFLTQIGTEILPYVNEFADKAVPKVQRALETAGDYVEKTIIPTAEKTVKWIGENKKAILTVAGALGTAVGAFKGLKVASAAVGAVTNISTVFRKASESGGLLSKVLGMGGSKLALIAVAIAAVAAGFVYLWGHSEKFRETVISIWEKVQPLATGLMELAGMIGSLLVPVFEIAGMALINGLGHAVEVVAPVIENIMGLFTGLIDFITGVFTANWELAWQGVCEIFGNLIGGIVNIAKVPINAVTSAINSVIEAINQCGFTIPEWVPVVGGKSFSLNLPTIPQLATGGIVTAPTILEAGEGGEPEAVLPLSKLAAMLQSVANAPEIPDLGNQEDGPEEAPLAQLAKMLDDWTGNKKPGPQIPGLGGAGPLDYQEMERSGGNDSPPPAGGQNPQGGGGGDVKFEFHYHGPASPEQAKEAAKIGFEEFKRLYNKMKAEERRKNLRAPTH